eukprot:3996760-Amphidinium_carterae.1
MCYDTNTSKLAVERKSPLRSRAWNCMAVPRRFEVMECNTFHLVLLGLLLQTSRDAQQHHVKPKQFTSCTNNFSGF